MVFVSDGIQILRSEVFLVVIYIVLDWKFIQCHGDVKKTECDVCLCDHLLVDLRCVICI